MKIKEYRTYKRRDGRTARVLGSYTSHYGERRFAVVVTSSEHGDMGFLVSYREDGRMYDDPSQPSDLLPNTRKVENFVFAYSTPHSTCSIVTSRSTREEAEHWRKDRLERGCKVTDIATITLEVEED